MQKLSTCGVPRKLALNTLGRVSCLSESDGKPVIGGHGAVYYDGTPGTEYNMWGVKLRLKKGCLDETLKTSDVRSFFNHDENYLLGRNKAGTMELSLDGTGCFYRTFINPDDPQAMSVHAKISRGDCDGSSFMFHVQDSEYEQKDGEYIEWITRIDPVLEMGPVVFPAMTSANSVAMDEGAANEYLASLKARIENPALAQRLKREREMAMSL